MNIVCASKMQAAMTGAKTFRWSFPPSAARETVRSLQAFESLIARLFPQEE